jgi:hypothetical protein
MCISFKGLNFAFKSISSYGGLDSTRWGPNIFHNLNKTFLSDLLEGETVSVYWENKTRTTMSQLWKEFSLSFLDEFKCNLLQCRLLRHIWMQPSPVQIIMTHFIFVQQVA